MIAFRQTMPYLWKQGQSLDLNVGDPDNGNFSLLECLEDLRGPDGMFRFMYRDRQHEGQYVVRLSETKHHQQGPAPSPGLVRHLTKTNAVRCGSSPAIREPQAGLHPTLRFCVGGQR